MAMPLKSVAQRLVGTASQTSWALQRQSLRSVGDLPVKNNPHIETWSTFREHVEDTFKFDAPTLARIAVWAIGVPVFFYTSIVGEFDMTDKKAGRKAKDFM